MTTPRPVLRLLPSRHKRVVEGHPWIYSNEAQMDAVAKAIPPGSVVKVAAADGRMLGAAFFNPHSLICGRMLSREPEAEIGAGFLAQRLRAALSLRETLYPRPFYRLVHSEGDGLPGLIVDRFGDVVVCQINAAGMDRLSDALLAALDEVLAPKAVVFRNDAPVRELEGLAREVTVAKGEVQPPIEIEEGGARFLVDPVAGQKTGWFFDQRDNRGFMAALARGRRVADFYAYTGGFAILSALAGAREVRAFDASQPALDLAGKSAELNGVAAACRFTKAEAFGEMERLGGAGERFEVVICDPPAFVKSRKDVNAGAKGYRKMARLAAALVAPGGFLFAASCSHNMETARFAAEIHKGIAQAGRAARVIRQAGASPDHPIHPSLPESAYLKAEVLQLD
ncbi:MAG TPA: class I SAM-dependent rRNA methyltransferase [Alphaproteobacteria bacterium]|jgi:23S rRNA (cytosine1962-C5)-methyltransferase|nr:class I SAM-dependent rRNA methyltransferase [Alphaproteobacteria bacterium]